MELLQNIYLFETGEACPGDDFLPLFIYTLLHSKLTNLGTLIKYISHFLLTLTEKYKILESKEKYIVTTFISAAEHIYLLIDQFKKT